MIILITVILNILVTIALLIIIFKTNKIKTEIKTSNETFKNELHVILDAVIMKLMEITAKVDDDRQKSIELVSKIIDKMNRLTSQLSQIKQTNENLDRVVSDLYTSFNKELKIFQNSVIHNKENANLMKSKLVDLNMLIKNLKQKK